ncbi:MAG: hypothetical protein WCA08_07210 [Desulfoferrobacter sp.]
MTQILLYQCSQGITLATDSKAVSFLPGDRINSMTVQKIFTLSSHAVLATGGAGYGVLVCQRLQSHIKSEGESSFDDIRKRAVPYLQEQIDRVHAENLYSSDRPDLERVYFLLTGYVPEASSNPYRFDLFGSEQFGDPLHVIGTGQVVAIPRQMGIEFRLSRLPKTAAELDEAETICENFLIKLSRETTEVGPPFYFVRVTAGGIKIRTRDSLD